MISCCTVNYVRRNKVVQPDESNYSSESGNDNSIHDANKCATPSLGLTYSTSREICIHIIHYLQGRNSKVG